MADPITPGFDFKCDRGETLTGDGAGLHCDHCRETVYDLATLTRDGAIALLARPRIPCVRLTVGGDGRAMFRRPRRLATAALTGALAGALIGGAAAAPERDPSIFSAAAARLDALIAEAEADAAKARAEAAQVEAGERAPIETPCSEADEPDAPAVIARPAEVEQVAAKATPARKRAEKARPKRPKPLPRSHTSGRPRR